MGRRIFATLWGATVLGALAHPGEVPCAAAESGFRSHVPLDGAWKVSPIEGGDAWEFEDSGLRERHYLPEFSDAQWKEAQLPHLLEGKGRGAFLSVWYRRRFALPEAKGGARALLHFERVDCEARVWVNGKEVGKHTGTYTPFAVDATEAVRFGGENLAAVRVLKPVFRGTQELTDVPWCEDDHGGFRGIWGRAHVEIVPAVHVAEVLIDPRPAESRIEVRARVVNGSGAAVTCELRGGVRPASVTGGAPGDTVLQIALQAGSNDVSYSCKIADPVLWSPDNPHLYVHRLSLWLGGRETDRAEERFGLREFKAVGRHFYLNGRRILLTGGQLHYFPERPHQRSVTVGQLKALKAARFNIVRTHSRPWPREFYEKADEAGMLLYSECAWYQNANLGPRFVKQACAEETELVRARYNHPSIVMWSLSNEVSGAKPEVADAMSAVYDAVRELDRSGRPIASTSGMCGGGRAKTDVFDCHTYWGTMGAPPWTFVRDDLSLFRQGLRKAYGGEAEGKPVIVWECVGTSWERIRSFAPDAARLDTLEEYRRHSVPNAPPYIRVGGSLREIVRKEYAPYYAMQPGLEGIDPNILEGPRHEWYAPAAGRVRSWERLAKRILEVFREMGSDEIAGFAGYTNTPANVSAMVHSPLFAGLRQPFDKNVFAGARFAAAAYVNNDRDAKAGDVRVVARLVGPGEKTFAESEVLSARPLDPFARASFDCGFDVPDSAPTGVYRLHLFLHEGGKAVFRNDYDLCVVQRKDMAPISAARKVCLYANAGPDAGREKVRRYNWSYEGVLDPASTMDPKGFLLASKPTVEDVLRDLRVDFTRIEKIAETKDLLPYGAVIVAPDSLQTMDAAAGSAVDSWMREGGVLLCLEQYPWRGDYYSAGRPLPFAPGLPFGSKGLTAAMDLVVPGHPIFDGTSERAFWDTWNGDRGVYIESGLCRPDKPEEFRIPDGALAVSSGVYGIGKTFPFVAVLETPVGKGKCLFSAPMAVKRYGADPVATRYLYNLVRWAVAK